MSTFIQQNKQIRVADFQNHFEELPVGVYNVCFCQLTGYYLTVKDPFSMPVKIYGGTDFPARILSTYKQLKRGMGVLLSGQKGAGKTVDAKLTALHCGMPVITITENFTGVPFSEFINSIQTPSMFFIDEFEKVYNENEERNFFLSIMDGVGTSRHLFMLTSNNEDIGEFFDSRPGRVRYHKHYEGLSDELIEEIIDDKLINKALKESVMEFVMKMADITIDSLTCMIEECNLHDETPDKFMSFFNVKDSRVKRYEIAVEIECAVPKTGLKAGQLKAAKSAAYDYNEYESKDDKFDQLCEIRKVLYTNSYAEPFDHYNDAVVFAANGYNEEGTYKSFEVTHNQITEFTNSRQGFRIVTKDGKVITGRPAPKSVWSKAF